MSEKSSQQRAILRAHELVELLCQVKGMDVMLPVEVAGVPRRNYIEFLNGRSHSMRPETLVAVIEFLGLKMMPLGKKRVPRLNPDRVHFWGISTRRYAGKKAAVDTLVRLSPLLVGAQMTLVQAKKKRTGVSYCLIRGEAYRLVVAIDHGRFGRMPALTNCLHGVQWRDQSATATRIEQSLYDLIMQGDLTVHEFDRAFLGENSVVNWSDVALTAREYGVTPEDVIEWLHAGALMAVTDEDAYTGAAPEEMAAGGEPVHEVRTMRRPRLAWFNQAPGQHRGRRIFGDDSFFAVSS